MRSLRQGGVRLACLVVLALLIAHTLPTPSLATSIRPKPWRLVVFDAVFVGIVECEVAGIVTADYRVLESFKGPPPGSLLRIRGGLEAFQPGIPTALIGERYLVYATRLHGAGEGGCFSTEPGCGEPYWWRDIPCSLSTSAYWGATPIDIDANRLRDDRHLIRTRELSQCRDSLRNFLGLPRDVQEAVILNLGYPVHWLIPPVSLPTGSAPGREYLSAGDDGAVVPVGELLDSLIAMPVTKSYRYDTPAWRLGSCGGDSALALLRSPSGLAKFGADSANPMHPIWMIRNRRGLVGGESMAELGASLAEPETLSQLRKVLRQVNPSNRSRPDFRTDIRRSRAFIRLTQKDPEAVVNLLFSFSPNALTDREIRACYGLASYFGWKCTGNRAKHFRRLLAAPNPIVRTAAAVYLSFEDSTAGVAELRKLISEPGFPGAWAAVALASRGDKAAVLRALDCLQEEDGVAVDGRYASDLRHRLRVLLSNSAARNGVELPPVWKARQYQPDSGPVGDTNWLEYQAWWSQVRDQIVICDPWYPLLAHLKVD